MLRSLPVSLPVSAISNDGYGFLLLKQACIDHVVHRLEDFEEQTCPERLERRQMSFVKEAGKEKTFHFPIDFELDRAIGPLRV